MAQEITVLEVVGKRQKVRAGAGADAFVFFRSTEAKQAVPGGRPVPPRQKRAAAAKALTAIKASSSQRKRTASPDAAITAGRAHQNIAAASMTKQVTTNRVDGRSAWSRTKLSQERSPLSEVNGDGRSIGSTLSSQKSKSPKQQRSLHQCDDQQMAAVGQAVQSAVVTVRTGVGGAAVAAANTDSKAVSAARRGLTVSPAMADQEQSSLPAPEEAATAAAAVLSDAVSDAVTAVEAACAARPAGDKHRLAGSSACVSASMVSIGEAPSVEETPSVVGDQADEDAERKAPRAERAAARAAAVATAAARWQPYETALTRERLEEVVAEVDAVVQQVRGAPAPVYVCRGKSQRYSFPSQNPTGIHSVWLT